MVEAVGRRKRIGLVAHDNKKRDLIEWARYNRLLRHGHDGDSPRGFAGRRRRKAPVGPAGWRPAAGGVDRRWRRRPARVLLGPSGAPTARPGRQGAPADRRGLEHPDRLQPGVGRLHDLVAADDQRLHADRARLRDLSQPAARVAPDPRQKVRSGSRRSRYVAVTVNTSAEADASATRQGHLSRRLHRLP